MFCFFERTGISKPVNAPHVIFASLSINLTYDLCNSGIALEISVQKYIIGPKEMRRGLFKQQDLHLVITCICDRIKTALLVISKPRRIFTYLGPTFIGIFSCLIQALRV